MSSFEYKVVNSDIDYGIVGIIVVGEYFSGFCGECEAG
jgi:hypothetical protein